MLIDVRSSEGLAEFFRRKGGGGHGSGGHGDGASTGHSSGHSSGSGDDDEPSSTGSSPKVVSGSSGRPATRPFSVGSTSSSAVPYSPGGVSKFTLPSSSIFAGREAGGADRTQIYGTTRYGSGYTYGAYGSYVDGRPFPYVFWPVPIAPNYYGDNEYNVSIPDQRPGGNVSTAVVQSNVNATETYRIVGDNSSVLAVMDALASNCSVTNATATPFTADNETYPLPVQMIQWYRASTFGLSLDGYNNSAASYANMPQSNSSSPEPLSADSPLPSGLNMTLLLCINATIAAALPLVDEPAKKRLSSADIFLIVLGTIVFIVLVIYLLSSCSCNLPHVFSKKYWARRRYSTIPEKEQH